MPNLLASLKEVNMIIKYYAALRELVTLRVFLIFWFGQLLSLMGSGVTAFALDLWVYQKTGSVTQFALVSLSITLPRIVIAPIAGVFVDRWDRRLTMFWSNCAAGLLTLLIALLFSIGQLQVWQIVIITILISISAVFQNLAGMAAVNTLVPDEHLSRGVSLIQIGQAASTLFAPVIAGTLVLTIKMQGVFLIDFASYLVFVGILLLVRFPNVLTETESEATKPTQGWAGLRNDLVYAWQYTLGRLDLLAFLLYTTAINFVVGFVAILLVPMLLTFISPADAGLTMTTSGFGLLFGSLLVGVFGGAKRQVRLVLLSGFCLGLFIMGAGFRADRIMITAAIFGAMSSFTVLGGLGQVLLLKTIPAAVQGRIFGLQGMIVGSCVPLSALLSGPLADQVFEPLLAKNGALANSLGHIIGVGSGRGIACMFILLGIMQIIITILFSGYRPLWLLDRISIQQPKALDGDNVAITISHR
jgi:MFS transporter, DHA3 family, macrolide efflux protein